MLCQASRIKREKKERKKTETWTEGASENGKQIKVEAKNLPETQ